MGKKPVLGLAGLFLVSAVLCGCKGNNNCGPTCPSHGGTHHSSAGQPGWNTLQQGRATVQQPGGMMPGGTVGSPTSVGSAGTTSGFNQFGTTGVPTTGMSGGSTLGGNPAMMGTGGSTIGGPVHSISGQGNTSSSFQRAPISSGQPTNLNSGSSFQGTTSRPVNLQPTGGMSGMGTSPQGSGSMTAPRDLKAPITGSGTGLPLDPIPSEGSGNESRYQQAPPIPAPPPNSMSPGGPTLLRDNE